MIWLDHLGPCFNNDISKFLKVKVDVGKNKQMLQNQTKSFCTTKEIINNNHQKCANDMPNKGLYPKY